MQMRVMKTIVFRIENQKGEEIAPEAGTDTEENGVNPGVGQEGPDPLVIIFTDVKEEETTPENESQERFPGDTVVGVEATENLLAMIDKG